MLQTIDEIFALDDMRQGFRRKMDIRTGGRFKRKYMLTGMIGLIVFWASLSLAALTNELVVHSWNLCDYETDLDGQWQGITIASDGNCYFASSTHSGRTGAMFFKFDTKAMSITPLSGDITRICGEDPSKTAPQGKIHSDVVEINGWLYFGTHGSYYRRVYTGAHLIGYEIKTGKFRDFGVIHKGYTNYAGVAADQKNNYVYMYLVYPGQRNGKPCLLYRIDLLTGTGGENWRQSN